MNIWIQIKFIISEMSHFHAFIYDAACRLLERRPQVGYLFASVSGIGGFIGLVETATKVFALVSVIVGLVVGCYTLRIQKRTWDQGQRKAENPEESDCERVPVPVRERKDQ